MTYVAPATEANIQEFLALLKEEKTTDAITLIESNIDLRTAKTPQGVSLLMMAGYYKNEKAFNAFLTYRAPLDIFEATAAGDVDLVENFIQTDSTAINATYVDGFTPLGLAAYFGRVETVKYLIEQGAEVNMPAQNHAQVTPLHSAVANEHIEVATILLQNGANVNAKQQNDVTALHSATHRGNKALVKLLLDFSADICAKMKDSRTPLDFARAQGLPDIEALLHAKLDECE